MALKLDAFPFTRFGQIKGRVYKLGRDTVQTRQVPGSTIQGLTGAPAQQSASGVIASVGTAGLSYPATITLNRDWIVSTVGASRCRLASG